MITILRIATTQADMPNDTSRLLGIVIASPSKKKILQVLGKMQQATPTEVSSKTGMLLTNVSRTIKQLESQNMVKCTTPGLRKGKMYELTADGHTILQMIKHRKA